MNYFKYYFLFLMALCFATTSAVDTTWELACNGVLQTIPVHPKSSFIYPMANAAVKLPLANDCQLKFVADADVVMQITVAGSYNLDEMVIGVNNIIFTPKIQNSFDIPVSAMPINVTINKNKAASGPLTFTVNALSVNANDVAVITNSQDYQVIYTSSYNKGNDVTFSVSAPLTNTLIYFFCYPLSTSDLLSNIIFFDNNGNYLTDAGQFGPPNVPYVSKKMNGQVYYHINANTNFQIIAYATNSPLADWSSYTSQIWDGAVFLISQTVVFGRQSGTDPSQVGGIAINSVDPGVRVLVYIGIIETPNFSQKGPLINCTNVNMPSGYTYISSPVITVIVTGGEAKITLITVPSGSVSTQNPASGVTTTWKTPITTSTSVVLSVVFSIILPFVTLFLR